MKVRDIKEFLEDKDNELEVSFCYGNSIAYAINRVYLENDVVWLDTEEYDDINDEDSLLTKNPFE